MDMKNKSDSAYPPKQEPNPSVRPSNYRQRVNHVLSLLMCHLPPAWCFWHCERGGASGHSYVDGKNCPSGIIRHLLEARPCVDPFLIWTTSEKDTRKNSTNIHVVESCGREDIIARAVLSFLSTSLSPGVNLNCVWCRCPSTEPSCPSPCLRN